MGKAPASQFYWGDWLNDVELQSACSASRGIWANALARMWFSEIKGELIATPEKFTQILNCTKKELVTFFNDISALHFCYISQNGNGTVTLRNRRMYREEKTRNSTRLRVRRYREKRESNKPSNASVTVPSSSSIKEYKETNLVTAKTVLLYLNEIGAKKFTPTEANLTPIVARLKEGHTLEECKKVIDIKARDPDFQDKYFRPVTLFRASKFEGYLNEKPKENIW